VSTRAPLAAGLAVVALFPITGCASSERVRPVEPSVQVPVAPPISVVPAPAAEGPPTMPFDAFLPEMSDGPRRKWLWTVFLAGQAQAWTFAKSPSVWITLRQIAYIAPGNKAGDWSSSGKIELLGNSEPGLIFHETFHTVFSRSGLHAGNDGRWGEAFCDAFRFVAERELLSPPASPWVGKIVAFENMSFEEARHAPGNARWKTIYTYPASLIVKRAGGTMAGLRTLWFELIAERQRTGVDLLDQFFGYSPEATLEEWQQS